MAHSPSRGDKLSCPWGQARLLMGFLGLHFAEPTLQKSALAIVGNQR